MRPHATKYVKFIPEERTLVRDVYYFSVNFDIGKINRTDKIQNGKGFKDCGYGKLLWMAVVEISSESTERRMIFGASFSIRWNEWMEG